ncbi:MAG: bifunctional nuclease family protein [Treponema sp.]|nr:bifunctional nuclease family protein [Treponema sp.]
MREMLSAEIWSIVQTSQGNALLLRPRDLGIAVPIFIGQLELQSILIGREGVKLPRPLTHDLLLNMLRGLGLSLERVEVHELKDNTFYARLIISGGRFSEEEPLIMDSRPSDAFALAVRRRCPIFVASPVVEQAGIPLDFFLDSMEEAEENPPAGPEPSSEALSPETEKNRKLLEQLNRAVAAEEYELAAEIRDMLNQLDKERGAGKP